MAPPLQPFPVSELEDRVHTTTKNLKEKSRKLPRDFDLKKDCELLELVQYSCTTPEELQAKRRANPKANVQAECFPFVRLFRRCGEGEKRFHVETTAWEGEHKWEGLGKIMTAKKSEEPAAAPATGWPRYVDGFWAQK
jgi:hypothetical protein